MAQASSGFMAQAEKAKAEAQQKALEVDAKAAEKAAQLKAEAEKAVVPQAGAAKEETLQRAQEVKVAGREALARVDAQARYVQLKAREQELLSKETDLARRELEFGLELKKGEPNWPRKFCCISPMVHHDILGDIRSERVGFIRAMYANYWYTIFLIFANIIAALIIMIVPKVADAPEQKGGEKFTQHFGTSIVHLLGVPFAFIIWYWPIYKACKTCSPGQYIMGFIGSTLAVAYDAFCVVGLVGYGGCGFGFMGEAKAQKGDIGLYCGLIITILYLLQAVFFIWAFYKLIRLFKQDKASIRKAQTELVAGAF